MSAEALFIRYISKIKRRVAIQTLHGILLHASLIFLCANTLFLALPMFGFTNYHVKGGAFFLAIGFSVSAAVVMAVVARSRMLTILIDIDHRLGLQDRLSTAYEYSASRKISGFTDLLINDAAAVLQQFSPGQLLPLRFSRLHLAAAALILVNVFFYSGLLQTPEYNSNGRNAEKINSAAKVLQSYIMKRVDQDGDSKTGFQSEYSTKLENLSSRLNDSSKPTRQRLAALDSFLKEVQGERTRMAAELGTRLDSAGIKNFPERNSPNLAKISSNQLEKLKAFLDKTLNNGMPEAINRNIESLQELDGMEKLLARIIDELKENKPDSDDPAAAAVTEQAETRTDGKLEKSPDGTEPSDSIRQFSSRSGSPGTRTGHQGTGNSDLEDVDPAEEMDPRDGNSASAGRGRSNSNGRSSHSIENAPGAAARDKPASSRAKSYLIHIRALTEIGEAQIKEDEVYRTYRREVEGILQKEEMPENYREYIKNYFISVGMHREDKADEYK